MQFASKANVCERGQDIDGGILSTDVTLNEQEDWFDDWSVAVIVIAVDPIPKIIVPGAGVWDKIIAPTAEQLSLTVTRLR